MGKRTPQLVVFDLDGTLYQTTETWIPAVKKAFSAFNAPSLETSCFRAMIGLPDTEVIAWYGNYISEEKMDDFLNTMRNEMVGIMEQGNYLFPGCREALAQLQDQDITMAVCSNGHDWYVEHVLASHNLDAFFSSVVTPDETHTEKTACLARLLAEHQERPAVMVGDRAVDITAAKANGIHSIGAAYGYGPLEEIEQADLLIQNLNELPGALRSLLS